MFDLGFRLLYPNGGGGDNAPSFSLSAAKNSTLESKPLCKSQMVCLMNVKSNTLEFSWIFLPLPYYKLKKNERWLLSEYIMVLVRTLVHHFSKTSNIGFHCFFCMCIIFSEKYWKISWTVIWYKIWGSDKYYYVFLKKPSLQSQIKI